MNTHEAARMQERAWDRYSLNNANMFWNNRRAARNGDPLAARAHTLQRCLDGYALLHENIRARHFTY